MSEGNESASCPYDDGCYERMVDEMPNLKRVKRGLPWLILALIFAALAVYWTWEAITAVVR